MPWIYADVKDRAESDFEFKLIFQAAVLITNNTVSPLPGERELIGGCSGATPT
jgi:hypothetical protein